MEFCPHGPPRGGRGADRAYIAQHRDIPLCLAATRGLGLQSRIEAHVFFAIGVMIQKKFCFKIKFCKCPTLTSWRDETSDSRGLRQSADFT